LSGLSPATVTTHAIAKSLAAAPYAETKSADLAEAQHFAEAIRAKFPGKLLAYNLSPSFNWDTTGMNDEQMRDFPIALGKMDSIHYVTPTDDNRRQTEGMKANGLFAAVAQEVGEIIVADVNQDRIRELLAADKVALKALIAKG
jgi:isocitrate lyase